MMESHLRLSKDSDEDNIRSMAQGNGRRRLPSSPSGTSATRNSSSLQLQKLPKKSNLQVSIPNEQSDTLSFWSSHSGQSTVAMSNLEKDAIYPCSSNQSGFSTVVASNRRGRDDRYDSDKKDISPTSTAWSILTDKSYSIGEELSSSPSKQLMKFQNLKLLKKSPTPSPTEKFKMHSFQQDSLLEKDSEIGAKSGDQEAKEQKPFEQKVRSPATGSLPTARPVSDDEPIMHGRMDEIDNSSHTVGTDVDSEWSIDSNQYNSDKYSYAGFGTGPPAGKKTYKGRKELKELTPPECKLLSGGNWYIQLYWLFRLVATLACGFGVMAGMVYSYGIGLDLLKSNDNRFAFGVYGAGLLVYLIIQSLFASLENRKFKRSPPPEDYENTAQKTIALQISAYQEDVHYFRECLKGAMELKYPRDKLKIICCIDGNDSDSVYMAEIFNDIVREYGEEPAFFRWDYNFHELPDGLSASANGIGTLEECIETNQFVCIMQKWAGKREVMYTAFKTLKDKVDYVQVCDSDTQLDSRSMLELAWILDSQPNTGAVGGDVRIWNSGDSFISFLSSLRYWMAFNVERSCQSYFGCVSCISGPIGLYRMSLITKVIDLWSDQKFLGDVCTFGDDRHLTNRILQMGYVTKYTSRSFCKTETPSTYLRWLSQQIRWTKSYYREWLFNAQWWHKHSLWMACEAIFSGAFPFFIMFTIIDITWSGQLWALVHLLIIVQLVGLLKGIFGCVVKRDIVMIFMSLYSCLYVTSLLPSKLFAIFTITKKTWGTSGRKNLLINYNPLIPVSLWTISILGGLAYSAYVNDYSKDRELFYLIVGGGVYAGYWLFMVVLWKLLVQKHHETRDMIVSESDARYQDNKTSSKESTLPSDSVYLLEGVDKAEEVRIKAKSAQESKAILANLRDIEAEDGRLDSLVHSSQSSLPAHRIFVESNDAGRSSNAVGEGSKAILESLRDIEQGKTLPSPCSNHMAAASPSNAHAPTSPSASSAYSYENFLEDFRRSERESASDIERINL